MSLSGRVLSSSAALLGVALGCMAAPGLSFKERMPGYLTPGRADFLRDGGSQRAELRARISTEDAEAFFADPRHGMALEGELRVRTAPSTVARYPLEEGRFYLLEPGIADGTYYLRYRFLIRGSSGRPFYFEGIKTVRDDPGSDMLRDTTTLETTLRRGGWEGPLEATGRLRFRLEDPWNTARFLGSFRVPRAGWRTKARVIHRFLKLFLGRLAEVYL